MILYTDWTDFTESHGKSIKKSVFIRARPPKDPLSNVLITAIPNENVSIPELRPCGWVKIHLCKKTKVYRRKDVKDCGRNG